LAVWGGIGVLQERGEGKKGGEDVGSKGGERWGGRRIAQIRMSRFAGAWNI